MERDVVCGMSVEPKTAQHKAEHAGKTYYFCSAGCKRQFEAAPGTFVAKA